MEDQATAVIKAAGGKVLGGVKHPLSTQDFSSFMLQAQASKAKIVGLANAGMDTVNAIKQAGEFGLVKGGQRIAGLLIFESDVQSLGLQTAQGLVLTTAFYWDQNDETRAWTKKFRAKRDKVPNLTTAGVYSATLHYLKAVQAAGTDEPKAVMAKMHEMPINDMMTRNAKLREDGRVMRDMYLAQVKAPAGVQGQGRYLQDPGHGSGRAGLASPQGRQLPADQVVAASIAARGRFARSALFGHGEGRSGQPGDTMRKSHAASEMTPDRVAIATAAASPSPVAPQ